MNSDNDLFSVDRNWYLSRYHDVADSGIDACEHFHKYGKQEGRFPNSLFEQILNQDSFDRDWYKNFYRHILGDGIDPAEHYLSTGKRDNKFANADALRRASLLKIFDPIWYLARNSDVAKSRMEPFEHFLQYGQIEGRSPNERLESRTKWRRWFDPLWYTARYPDINQSGLTPLEHYLRIGVYEGRSPHSAAEDKDKWDEIVDENWYANRYSDVATSGLNSLDHFIKYGIVSHRRPNASAKIHSEPVENASTKLIKSSSLSDHVVLFVTFTPTSHLRPHIIYHLNAFREADLSTFLIIAADSPSVEIDENVYALSSAILKRENKGFDFAAWAHVLKLYPELLQKKSLILANDSAFGPFTKNIFVEMLKGMHASNCDIIGLTENEEFGRHLQSFFLLLKRTAITSSAFKNFIDNIVSFRNKEDVIYEYETQFTRQMVERGLLCEAFYDSIDSTNPTYYRWRDLIETGFPYLKISVLLGDAVRRGVLGWRDQLRRQGYSTVTADRVLAENYLTRAADNFLDFSRGHVSQRGALHNLHCFFASEAKITFNSSPAPKMSVVVLLHNKAEHLLSFIREIQSYQCQGEIELIIVDCNSNDETSHLCSYISGPSIIRYSSPKNLTTMLNDIFIRTKTSNYLLLRDVIYFDTKAIDLALSYLDQVAGGKVITGTVEEFNHYSTRPYPLPFESEMAHFQKPEYSVFDNTSEDTLDYMSIFSKFPLERCKLLETEIADGSKTIPTLRDLFRMAELEIKVDDRLGIVAL